MISLPSLSCGTSVMKTFEPPKPGHCIRWVCRELVLATMRSVHFSVSMLFSWLPVWLWLNILPVKWWWSFLALKKVTSAWKALAASSWPQWKGKGNVFLAEMTDFWWAKADWVGRLLNLCSLNYCSSSILFLIILWRTSWQRPLIVY